MGELNKILLHLEGLAVFILCIYAYSYFDFSWILFFVLLLAPDIAMLAYLLNNKIGAILYNIFHTYLVTVTLIIIGLLASQPTILAISLIWTAHIAMDRIVGFGLKYTTDFKDTHLNRV